MKINSFLPFLPVLLILFIGEVIKSNLPIKRGPASVLSNIEYSIFKDFLDTTSHPENIRMEVIKEFETNKDANYIKKSLRNILANSINETAKDINDTSIKEKPPLPSLFKNSLLGIILDHLKKNPLVILKYINGEYLFKFHILPTTDHLNKWNYELSTNQFVDWKIDNTKSLYSMMEQPNFSVLKSIVDSRGLWGDYSRYLGGSIIIKLDIADLDLNKNVLPDVKANALKGRIILRRYFEHVPRKMNYQSTKNNNFKVGMVFKSGHVKDFATIDEVFDFNLKSPMPSKTKTIFYPGSIVEERIGDNIPIIDLKKKTKISRVSDWFFEHEGSKHKKRYKIKRLVFNNKTKVFDSKESIFKEQNRRFKHKGQVTVRSISNARLMNEFNTEVAFKLLNDLNFSTYLK